MLQLLFPLLVFSIIWRQLIRKERFAFDYTMGLFILYCTLLAFSSLIATNPVRSDERLVEHLKVLCLFWVVLSLATSISSLRRTIWVLVAVGAFLGTISVYQVATHSYFNEFGGFGRIKLAQILGDIREPRIAGPLSDPNFYAQILVMLLPMALYRLWDEASMLWKAVAAYSLVVVFLALVFTYSRGAALAVGILFVLAGIERKVKLKYLLLTAGVLVPLIFVVPKEFTGRLSTLEELVETKKEGAVKLDSSFQERKLYMQSAFEMFLDHPWLGVGAGNFATHYEEYSERIGTSLSSYANFGQTRYPHSLYLEIAAETGIIGLLIFSMIAAATLYNAWSARKIFLGMEEPFAAGIVTSLALGFVGYLTTSLFLHGDYIRYFWLLIALISSVRSVAGKLLREKNEAV